MQEFEHPVARMNPIGREEWRYSDWLEIDQDRITTFGLVTEDPDPLHIDPVYAGKHGPYGGTIAFGFLTMSLLTYFHHQVAGNQGSGYALNYGFDRLRLPSVVKVGARIRGGFRLLGVEDKGEGRVLLRYDTRIEIEGEDKPALAAEWLAMWIDDGLEHSVQYQRAAAAG